MTVSPTDKELPLVQHLIELRNRLLRIVVIVLVIFLGLFYFANDIYTLTAAPLQKFLPESTGMIATDVTSPFLAPFKLTLFVAVLLAAPFILHQIWAFIAPGLYKHEKQLAVPLLVSSVVLFYGGMAFAYFVVFPLIFGFFTSVGPEGVSVMTDISSYLDFVLKLFFAFGVAFEIPIATILMIRHHHPSRHRSKAPLCGGGLLRDGHATDPPGYHLSNPTRRAHVAAVRGRGVLWPHGLPARSTPGRSRRIAREKRSRVPHP